MSAATERETAEADSITDSESRLLATLREIEPGLCSRLQTSELHRACRAFLHRLRVVSKIDRSAPEFEKPSTPKLTQ